MKLGLFLEGKISAYPVLRVRLLARFRVEKLEEVSSLFK